MGPGASLALLASIIVSFLAASSAPTPLYALYQARWGFTQITTTVVFGVYAVAVLVALLVFGRLSDHLGRRPVLLAALVVQAVAMLVFATAGGVTALLVARVVQGLATGAAVSAIGAGLLDIDRTRGTVANSVAPGIGTGGGALLSALIVQYLPAPSRLVYLLLLAVFALQVVGVALLRETASPKPGALAPRPGDRAPAPGPPPRRDRRPRAVLGLGPGRFLRLARPRAHRHPGPLALGRLRGLSLFVLAGVASLSVLLLRNAPTHTVLYVGILALVIGVGITLVSIAASSTAASTPSIVISGVGFGSGFQGGIKLVMPLTRPHERAGVLSLLYVVCYLGMGFPAVVAGVLVVHSGGLLTTAREYGIAVIVLALAALLGLLTNRPASSPVPAAARP
ncbi:MFS transporter [Streptosporangium lutulentum]